MNTYQAMCVLCGELATARLNEPGYIVQTAATHMRKNIDTEGTQHAVWVVKVPDSIPEDEAES